MTASLQIPADQKNGIMSWSAVNIGNGASVDIISQARHDIIRRILTTSEAENQDWINKRDTQPPHGGSQIN